ncbi:hypothetical protein JMJ77_0011446 [Colletotrichum scovillei]|uniref:Uncharacterized protein n=1 Tax=Colletotrichum scovillei TaxID=1209932 RepID=A0A9P7U7K8_9PEZI|nr:hypothetical protein JMJ78_0008138 [Colletotrichum scovillei]KAG7040584.1 hypothetical protein JMJ77_0011446 [Colletotrichum scovillei]KAG7060633.1 hypothetical protein JMJ76_0012204 [Colletotrichum scovillei]
MSLMPLRYYQLLKAHKSTAPEQHRSRFGPTCPPRCIRVTRLFASGLLRPITFACISLSAAIMSSTGAVYNGGHRAPAASPTAPPTVPFPAPAPAPTPTPAPTPAPQVARPAIPVSSDSAYSINRYVDTPTPSDRQIRAPLFSSPLPSPSPEEAELAGKARMEALLKEIYPHHPKSSD